MESTTEASVVSRDWVKFVLDFVEGNHNNSMDIRKPHLRHTFLHAYPYIIGVYAVLAVTGVILNLVELYAIVACRMYRDATYVYFINMAISDIVKCVVVLPFTVTSLLVQNWLFGKFFCYFLPMLQDVPSHVTVLSLFMIALDRYNFLKNPSRMRLPGFIFSIGTWFTAICVVLPYPIYTTYIDLSEPLNTEHTNGVGICIFNLEKDLKEYSRAIFIAFFLVPVFVIIYLHSQMFQILEDRSDEVIIVQGFEIRLKGSLRRYYSRRFSGDPKKGKGDKNEAFEDDIDPKEEEKRIQKYLISIFAVFSVCFVALSTLRFMYLNGEDTYENSHQWDLSYSILVWTAYFPTVITPIIVLCMMFRSNDIYSLRNYLKMKRKSIFGRHIEEEDSNVMTSVTYYSRPSAATISTDYGAHHEKSTS